MLDFALLETEAEINLLWRPRAISVQCVVRSLERSSRAVRNYKRQLMRLVARAGGIRLVPYRICLERI